MNRFIVHKIALKNISFELKNIFSVERNGTTNIIVPQLAAILIKNAENVSHAKTMNMLSQYSPILTIF